MQKKSPKKTKVVRDEQAEFYKAHPNSKPLLVSFLILVLLLGFLYYVKFGFALMP